MRTRIAIFLVAGIFAGGAASFALTPAEILQRVQAKYEQMNSFSADGTIVSVVDASAMAAKDGVVPPEVKNSKEYKEALANPVSLTHTVAIKLGRPNFYRIDWVQVVQQGFTNKGAVWCAGAGDFLLLGEDRLARQSSRELALASATGVSGGAAHTIPGIFFNGSSSLVKSFKDVIQQRDERVGGTDCFVLSGSVGGQKITLWIAKKDSLIKQKRLVLGGGGSPPEMSDDAIKQSLKELNKETTPEAIAEMRRTIQNARQMASQVKGTLTETYQNVVINGPVKKEQYQPKLPAGLKAGGAP